MGKATLRKQSRRNRFLHERAWEITKRKSGYVGSFEKFQQIEKTQSRNRIAKVRESFIKKFNIPPIHPSRKYDDILALWSEAVRYGSNLHFPLEVLYHEGLINYPLFCHPESERKIIIPLRPGSSVTETIEHLRGFLVSRGVRGSRAKVEQPPLRDDPELIKLTYDGEGCDAIVFDINLEATKKVIIDAVRGLLRTQGFKEETRKGEEKTFWRRIAVYDYVETHPKMPFIAVGRNLAYLYPKAKTAIEREKLCFADYDTISREIEPRKHRKNEGKKTPSISYLGNNYDEAKRSKRSRQLESVRSSGIVEPREDWEEFYLSDIVTSIQEPKGIRTKKSLSHAREEQYVLSPVKIFRADEYSQEFLTALVKPK